MTTQEKLNQAVELFQYTLKYFEGSSLSVKDDIEEFLESVKEEDVCEWSDDTHDYGIQCDGNQCKPLGSHYFKFCPYCGRKIVVKKEV